MALCEGNLRNTQTDIVIDSIICLVMVLAYFLQISHIMNVGSTHGISAYFLLFNALFCNHQLANTSILTARAWPTEKNPFDSLIGKGGLRGAQLLGAVLGMVQVTLHWTCSLMLLTVSLGYPLTSSESPSIAIIFSIHDLIFLSATLALMIMKSYRSPLEMGIDMIFGISGYVNTWMSLLFVILQFYPQLVECRSMSGSPDSLSLLSLGLRAVVMLAVAVRWFQRLGPPRFGKGDARPPLMQWYEWGWLPFNYIIEGIGCALLVGMYLRAGWMGATLNIAGNETPVVS